jgi:DNA polymerase-3 subunit alpha
MRYTSLHNHTQYSNLRLIDSINKEDELIKYAYSLGLSGVAITDHEAVSAHPASIDDYKILINKEYKKKHPEITDDVSFDVKCKDIDFQLILGNEIYMVREGLNEENYTKEDKFYHLILLAKDAEGHKQLRKLSSKAWTRGFFRNMLRVFTYPSDLYEIVKGGHLICSTACLGSYTGCMFKEGKYSDIDRYIKMLAALFGQDNFYIEIQPSFNADQIAYNKYLITTYWGKYPFIFTTDSHYLKKEDRQIHKDFLNSKSSNDREVDEFYSATYMMSFDEVWDYFKEYVTADQMKEMADNSNKIRSMCSFYELQKPQIVTKVKHEIIEDNRPIFDNIVDYTTHKYLEYYRYTANSADQYFFKLLANGWKKEEIEKTKIPKYIERLEEELTAIREISIKMGVELSDYFTSMAKMIQIIWNEADSIVGPSRGSAGAFLINFLLGITQMNPMEQPIHMYSWRFLHADRPGLPDIDIDTESAKRTKVFNRIQDYFRSIGGDVYNICTFGTEGSKSALRTAARGLNIDSDVISYLVSMVPNERGFDWTLHQCYEGDEDHKAIAAFKTEMDLYPELWKLSTAIEGLVTQLGVHASGIVCVNDDFTNYNSIMKTSKEQVVSAYDLHQSENCGLVKYDFLTVSALDRIRQTFNYLLEDDRIQWQGSLKATYDKYLNPKVINYNEPKMWEMVANGDITSIFQFDTMVGSQAIKLIKPQSLLDLAVSNSIMRLQCDGELPLNTFVRFKNDIDQWYTEMTIHGLNQEEIKVMEGELLHFHGVAASQESVMNLAMNPKIANFTMVEANKLRKTIAKKQFDKIEEVHQLFLKKGREVGSSEALLNYVWDVQISKSLG